MLFRSAELRKMVAEQQRTNRLLQGLLYGAVGQVDAIVRLIAAETRMRPKVVATGGFAKAIASHSKTIQKVDANLTLHGLRMIHEKAGGERRRR